MKYTLLKILTNDKGQDGTTVAIFEGENAADRAKVEYHQTLAAYHNAQDVLFAVVEILDEYGRIVGGCSEIVDHRPEPTPEPAGE